MESIGTVSHVQIQRNPMKTGTGEDRVYDPAPLLVVDRLLLTVDGIKGVVADGELLTDVHHVNHPRSRYRGDNKISFGFLQQYHRMRRRFGEHLVDGAGGENILFDSHIELSRLDLSRRLFIEHQDDGNLIELRHVIPAPPCREFSIYCHQQPISGAVLKSTLQFLDSGTRGYYAKLVEKDCQCFVAAGDVLYLA